MRLIHHGVVKSSELLMHAVKGFGICYKCFHLVYSYLNTAIFMNSNLMFRKLSAAIIIMGETDIP